MDACFTAFDKNGDGKLDIDEFRLICRALFRNDRGKIYTLEEMKLKEIFQVFDSNSDDFIGKLVQVYLTASAQVIRILIIFVRSVLLSEGKLNKGGLLVRDCFISILT